MFLLQKPLLFLWAFYYLSYQKPPTKQKSVYNNYI
jgi:hypothetical protein